MPSLDHIAVSAATLAQGAAHVDGCLGHGMGPGGAHPAMGTHNRLTGMGDVYLEVIAIDPDAAAPGRPRWFDLDRREGPPRLSAWVLRVADIEAACAAFPEAGRPVALARGVLRWRMAVSDDGALPWNGAFPAFLQWDEAPPAFAETGLRLRALTVRHPEAPALAARLASVADDPRLAFASGPVGLEAGIETPGGMRALT